MYPRLRGEVMAHKLEIARRKTALAGCRAIERYRAVTAERSRGGGITQFLRFDLHRYRRLDLLD